MEKAATTPEYYPMSLNALVNACNQKSSREPVMTLGEGEVREALHALERLGLVHHVQDSRVGKWEHTTGDKWNLRRDESALLCCLLLRGPQTPGELRVRTERLHTFAELDAVNASLERMAARQAAMTEILPKQAGAREARWRELVSEHVLQSDVPNASTGRHSEESADAATDIVRELREELDALRKRVEALEAAANLIPL